jgi:hypothetical protein
MQAKQERKMAVADDTHSHAAQLDISFDVSTSSENFSGSAAKAFMQIHYPSWVVLLVFFEK